jgi:hypothetical protein
LGAVPFAGVLLVVVPPPVDAGEGRTLREMDDVLERPDRAGAVAVDDVDLRVEHLVVQRGRRLGVEGLEDRRPAMPRPRNATLLQLLEDLERHLAAGGIPLAGDRVTGDECAALVPYAVLGEQTRVPLPVALEGGELVVGLGESNPFDRRQSLELIHP